MAQKYEIKARFQAFMPCFYQQFCVGKMLKKRSRLSESPAQ
jgi:hypothetical protein